MTVVATVAFCIGAILLGGAAIFVLLILGDLRALATLHRIRPAPIGSRGRVALDGVTEYGTAGRQTAPVTGEDCVWYRVTLLREPSRHSTGDYGPDHDVLLETGTPAWPTVTDHRTRIPVDPRLLATARALFDPSLDEPLVSVVTEIDHSRAAPVPLPPVVPAAVAGDLRKGERLRLTEVRVPRGVPVFALGRVTGDGLRPSRSGLTVFTTATRDEVIAARRESVRGGRTIAICFALIGLVLAGASVLWLRALG